MLNKFEAKIVACGVIADLFGGRVFQITYYRSM